MFHQASATASHSHDIQEERADDPLEPVVFHIEDDEDEEYEAARSPAHGCVLRQYFRRDQKDSSIYYCLKCPNSRKVKGKNTSNLWAHFRTHHHPLFLKHQNELKLRDDLGKKPKTLIPQCVDTTDDLESKDLPKKLKQTTIPQSFAKGTKCTELQVAEAALNFAMRCEHASIRIFDSAEFKTLLAYACETFETFDSSEKLLLHVNDQYNLNRKILSDHLLKSSSDVTVELKLRNVCENTYLTALVYFILFEHVDYAVITVKKINNTDDMAIISKEIRKVLQTPDIRNKISSIVVGTQPGLKEAALSECSTNIPVITCIFSALDDAWYKINVKLEELEFFKNRIAPLTIRLFSPMFLGSLGVDERKEVRDAKGSNADILSVMLKFNTKLANVCDDQDDLDILQSRERTIARELCELLESIRKLADSALLKPEVIHVSLWSTFQSLFAASLNEQTSHFTTTEAISFAGIAKKIMADCFMGGDAESSMTMKLLDYRTKNSPNQNAVLYSKCIAKLEDRLKSQTSNSRHNGNGIEKNTTDSGDGKDELMMNV